jgi:hypothetical protein
MQDNISDTSAFSIRDKAGHSLLQDIEYTCHWDFSIYVRRSDALVQPMYQDCIQASHIWPGIDFCFVGAEYLHDEDFNVHTNAVQHKAT